MTNQVETALGHIHNGAADYAEGAAILANSPSATAMGIRAGRLADDMAEAFGDPKHGASASDPACDIVERAQNKETAIRAIASFGAMARELRRLQDSEAEAKRQAASLRRDLAGALGHAKESAYQAACNLARAEESASIHKANHGLALESIRQYREQRDGFASRAAAYRKACDRLTFGELRIGTPAMRQLWNAYESDSAAFLAD